MEENQEKGLIEEENNNNNNNNNNELLNDDRIPSSSHPVVINQNILKKIFADAVKEANRNNNHYRTKPINDDDDEDEDSDVEDIDLIHDEELHFASQNNNNNEDDDTNYPSSHSPISMANNNVANRIIKRLKAKVKRLKKKMKNMEEKHESELQYMANAVTQAMSSNQAATNVYHQHQQQPLTSGMQPLMNPSSSSDASSSYIHQSTYTGQRIITTGSLEILKKHHQSEMEEMEEIIESQQDEVNNVRLNNMHLERENKHLRMEVLKASNHTKNIQKAIELIQRQMQGIKDRRREETEVFIADKQLLMNEKETLQLNLVMLQEENRRFKRMVQGLLKERKDDKDKKEDLEHEISQLKHEFEVEKGDLRRSHQTFKQQIGRKISSLGVDTRWIHEFKNSYDQNNNRETPRGMHRHEY